MLKMTAGNDQPQTIKMSTQPENKINKNILSDKIHPLKDTIENKHIKHTVQKCINFTEDNYTESNNETSANEPNRQKIERAKYIPGKEGDPVLEDFRILTGLLEMEVFYLPRCSNYMSKIQGNQLTPLMRKIVVDWMLEVCESHELRSQVFLMAVQYLDRVLSTRRIDKQQLQLLAAACLFISSKLHDNGPCRGGGALSVDKLVICTDCSIQPAQLYNMELKILDILNWELCSITSMEFIHMFIILLNKNINNYQGQSNSHYSSTRLSSTDSFSNSSSLGDSFLNTSTSSFSNSFNNSSISSFNDSFQSTASSSSYGMFKESLRMLLTKKESLLNRSSVLLCLAATEYQFYAVKPSSLAAAALSITIKELMVNTEGQINKETSSNLSQYLNQTLANMIKENKASLIMLENCLRTSLDSWRRSEAGETSGEFSDYYSSP